MVERASEMSQIQHQTEDQAGIIRHEIGAARDEMKNAVERFDFESKGLESVAGLERTADQTVSSFASGGSVQIQDVMTATAKANLGMQVMVELRNKALDAYQQIMNIQV
jgi:flagellar hook-basal body complex protein FliE